MALKDKLDALRGQDIYHQIPSLKFLPFPFFVGGSDVDSSDVEVVRKTQREMAKAELESSIGAPKGSVVSGSYVPPHMRGGSSSAAPVQATRGGPRKTKHAPDITSEIFFPSLSAAVGPNDPSREYE